MKEYRKVSSEILAATYLLLACFKTGCTSSALNTRQILPNSQKCRLQRIPSYCHLNRKRLISRQVIFDVENGNDWKEDVSISNSLSDAEAQSSNDVSNYSWMKTIDMMNDREGMTFRANGQIRSLMQLCQVDGPSHHAYTAESILRELEKSNLADTITFNSVINAYAKSSLHDSAERAERVLARMEKEHRKQKEVIMKYNQCVSQIQRSGICEDSKKIIEECGILECGEFKEPRLTVKPNVRTYSTVIDVYSRRSDADSVQVADIAQSLLDQLRTLFESTGDEEVKPNSISYNSVINAWAKTGTVLGAQNAMKLLTTMEGEGIADVISYNTVIHAWARCESKESGIMAEEILRRMQKRRSEANETMAIIEPNIRTFSSVIDAWSRCLQPDAAQRSQRILEEVEALYEKTGDSNIKPNTVSYSTVINAHARSRDMANKAPAALKVLQRMQHLFRSGKNDQAKPTIVTYNSVLNACATTYGNSGSNKSSETLMEDGDCRVYQYLALAIVKSIYKDLRSDKSPLRPDHFTYGTVLKACANLISPGVDDESDFIREVFEECCKDGQVSFGVCFQLRQAAPVDLYRELIPQKAMDLSNGHFNMDFMPKSWRRNVRERKRRIKK